MNGLFSSLLKMLVINLLVVLIFSYFAIAFLTSEFPPKITTIKNYASKISQVQDSMKMILNKSNTEIMKMNPELALSESGFVPPQVRDLGDNADVRPSQDRAQIQELNRKIMQLHAEIDQLRNENHALKTSLELRK